MARFVWRSMYENAVYAITNNYEGEFLGRDVVARTAEEVGNSENKVTVDELKLDLYWASMASTSMLNPDVRAERFMRLFGFFVPLLRELSKYKPTEYMKYFLRWMNRAAQEMDVPGIKYLIPTMADMSGIPAEGLQNAMEGIVRSVGSGQAPWMATQGEGRPKGEIQAGEPQGGGEM